MPVSIPVLEATRLAGVSPPIPARQSVRPNKVAFDAPQQLSASKLSQSTSAKPTEAFQQLEAMLVRSLMGAIIPKQSLGGAESGLAGEYWGSLLSDELADALSSGMRLGLAESVGKSMEHKLINTKPGGAE